MLIWHWNNVIHCLNQKAYVDTKRAETVWWSLCLISVRYLVSWPNPMIKRPYNHWKVQNIGDEQPRIRVRYRNPVNTSIVAHRYAKNWTSSQRSEEELSMVMKIDGLWLAIPSPTRFLLPTPTCPWKAHLYGPAMVNILEILVAIMWVNWNDTCDSLTDLLIVFKKNFRMVSIMSEAYMPVWTIWVLRSSLTTM